MKRINYFSLATGMLIIALVTACQSTSSARTKDNVRPTTSPLIRKIPTQFVEPPIVTLPENQKSGELIQYIHPSGAFQFQRPAGWEEDTSEYGSVFFSEPGGEGAIFVTATNTGYALSGEDFDRFVKAREENFFPEFNDYQALAEDYNEFLSEATITKSLLFNDIPETVDSYYFRQAEGVFAIDVWMETINTNTYREMYKPIIESFETTANKVNDFPLYNFVTTLYGPVDQYSFEVPISWQYQYENLDGVIADRFISPDGMSIIEHLTVYGINELNQKAQEQTLIDIFNSVWENPEKNLKVKKRENFEDGSIIYIVEI